MRQDSRLGGRGRRLLRLTDHRSNIAPYKLSGLVENQSTSQNLTQMMKVSPAGFQRGFCFTVKVFPAISIVPTRARLVLLAETE
jgi:hypothetical protein